MDKHEVDDLLTIFDDERFVFSYFKDRYALMLLADYVGSGTAMQQVKQSHLRGLLNKPRVKEAVQNSGDGVLRQWQLEAVWPRRPMQFVLTLGHWNGLARWAQTSRKGHNLVLQLNFSRFEDQLFKRWIRPKNASYKPFQYHGHPISQERNTLAWARIDLSLATGEALIEEIQTDYVRRLRFRHNRLHKIPAGPARTEWLAEWCDGSSQSVENYFKFILHNHAKLWDEAMLMATIWFLRHQLGIGRIFYHTWQSGLLFKRLDARWGPPMSLYTKLPRRFGFVKTGDLPSHMEHDMFRPKAVRKAYRKQPVKLFEMIS